MRNIIKFLMVLPLFLSMAYSYSLVTFNSDTVIPYSQDLGFTMRVTTTSGNITLEPLDDLDVHVTVLFNGVPMFTYCKYQDDNECYLWKTDQNGNVDGLVYIHSSYLVNENYTLKVTIGNVTVLQPFLVTEPVTDPSSWGVFYWLRYNLAPFMLIVALAMIAIVSAYYIFFKR